MRSGWWNSLIKANSGVVDIRVYVWTSVTVLCIERKRERESFDHEIVEDEKKSKLKKCYDV